MKKQNINPENAALLRHKAEELLLRRDRACYITADSSSEADLLKLIHELEVHQIELQMQNEELVIAKEKAKLAEEKYTDLYDFAPSGYIALSKNGEILELNFAAAKMLGKERTKLIKKRFDFFVSIDTQSTFDFFLQDVFTSQVKQTCEVIIATEGNMPIYVNIDGIVSQNNELCLLTVVDITEQKSVEKKLQSTVNDQNIMLSNDPTFIFFKDCKNNIIRVTESVAKATGMTREEIEGRPSKEIYPDMANQYWEDDLEVIKTGKPKLNIIEPLTGADGSNHWLLTNKIPVKNRSGEIVGVNVFSTDITNLKKVEFELIAAKEKAERNEKELIKAQKIAHVGSWYLNIETNEVLWSEELYKMYGFDPTQPIPPYTEHMKLFTPESWEILSISLAKTRETGIPYELELKTIRKDNSNGWMWVRGEAVLDEGNNIIGLWGAAQDITERKRTDDRLKESEARFKAVIDSLPLAVHITTELEQHTEYINPSMIKMFGYTMEEILSVAEWWPLAYPDKEYQEWVSSEWNARVATALETNSIIEPMEVICTCKDGTKKNIQWAYIATGGVNYSLGLDITERKHAELLIREKSKEIALQNEELNLVNKELIIARENAEKSEARFRNLMENIDTVAVQGYGPNGITQFWNKASEKLYGYTQQEAIGSSLMDLIIPTEMKDEVIKTMHEMAETGVPIPSGELLLKHKDGSPVPVISHHAVVSVPGHAQELFCLDVDITERRKAEKALLNKIHELELFQKLTVGRELTMIELKKEVNSLLNKAGEVSKYRIIE